MFKRILKLSDQNNSFFLFGPRQTGKTSLLKDSFKPDLYIDLLKNKEFLRYGSDLSLLEKEVSVLGNKRGCVIIDEIQRLPQLLNEVHSLMEANPHVQFVLTGSSARKLRAKGTNLLGGRALTFKLYPLTHIEMGTTFNLEDALKFGSLPKIASQKDEKTKIRLLRSYVETYLKEEIQQEALTRNVPAFAQFMELAAFDNGNLLNYNNIATSVGIGSKIIKEYYQILEDTLIGFYLYPYTKSHRDKLTLHPKFYFFDTGVVRALKKELQAGLIAKTKPYGHAFEHWCLLETKRLLDYAETEASLSFFRTNNDAEVDLILEMRGATWAIEFKSSEHPEMSKIKGLTSFISDHRYDHALCVCQTPRRYKSGKIEFWPWQEFMKMLVGF